MGREGVEQWNDMKHRAGKTDLKTWNDWLLLHYSNCLKEEE